jgi:hypothetical protein
MSALHQLTFYSQKSQNKKLLEAKAQLQQEILQLRQKVPGLTERRRQMQTKLKEIRERNAKKSDEMMYRNRANSTISSSSQHDLSKSSSSSSSRSRSFMSANSSCVTSFFDQKGPMFSQKRHESSGISKTSA